LKSSEFAPLKFPSALEYVVSYATLSEDNI